MKSKTICKNILSNVDLDFLDAEPFSKREALNWLMAKTNDTDSKVHLSARHIASIWRWHRSKVERFLKILMEKGLIETAPKTIIGANIDLNELKASERDNSETAIDSYQTQRRPCLQQSYKASIETNSRQIQDSCESKQEKEYKNTSSETVTETASETIRAHSIPCSSRLSENDQFNSETTSKTVSEAVIGTKIDPNELKTSKRDNFETLIDPFQTQQILCLQEIYVSDAETNSRQNPDNFEKKKKKEKKEKNQKKEKEEKEK